MRCARIEHFVNPVTDTHDFFLTLKFPFDEGVDFIEVADVLEHVDYAFVGAAVEGAFQGSDGSGDRRIHVGKGGNSDASGEGGGVHTVVGMEDEGNIEDARRGVAGDLTVNEIKEMLSLTEIGAVGREFESVTEAMVGGDDDCGFRAE